MGRKKVYFRADASRSIGYGHFIRSLALADMLKDDFECVFFTQTPTDYQKKEAEKVCPLVALPADETKFNLFLERLQGDEIVVLDNYFFTPEYQKSIKEKGCKLVCIDDMHDKHYYSDVVINYGIPESGLFDIEPYTRLCLGFEYALLRKPFLEKRKLEKKRNHWVISFGGVDYYNLTEKILSGIHNDGRVDSITVIIGDAYQWKESLQKYCKISLKQNLSAEQMAYEMGKAEFAVLPSSSVCIEALSSNCKVAAGYFIDNQKQYYYAWIKKKYILGIGDILTFSCGSIIDELIQFEPEQVQDFSDIRNNFLSVFHSL